MGGILDVPFNPNSAAALTDISALSLVPCTTSGLSFCENSSSAQSDGTQSKVTYYRIYAAAFDFSLPRLMFTNHYWNASGGQNGEHPGPATITITASIATDFASTSGTPSKTFVPVTFGGRSSYPLASGKIVFSDPVPITWKQGEIFVVRTCVTALLGTQWPLCGPQDNSGWVTVTSPTGYGVPGYLNGQDSTQTAGNVPANTGTQVNLYGPAGVFALPGPQGLSGVVCIGDSIARGFGDSGPYGFHGSQVMYEGFVSRALRGSGHGVVQISTGGDNAASFIQRGYVQIRRLMATNCQHAVVTMGRNDLSNGLSAATIEADLVFMWRHIAAWGLKVWATTIPPRSTSTDNFITTGNQTTDTTNTARVSINQWIRAGAPIDPTTKAPVSVGTGGALVAGTVGHPLTGTFDVATPMESAQDSGKWAVDVTGTGTTNTGGTITSATGGPWLKGMLIQASAGIASGGLYVFSVTGGGATLGLTGNPLSNQVGVTIANVFCTSDGIHPSPQGHYAGSAAITPASFSTSRTPTAVIPSGSPYAYHNTSSGPQLIVVSAGTVTDISYSTDGATYFSTALTSGQFRIEAGDYLKITYSAAPTVTAIPAS